MHTTPGGYGTTAMTVRAIMRNGWDRDLIVILTVITIMFMVLMWAAQVEPRCTEDMSCWDCSTMGNKICGVVDQ